MCEVRAAFATRGRVARPHRNLGDIRPDGGVRSPIRAVAAYQGRGRGPAEGCCCDITLILSASPSPIWGAVPRSAAGASYCGPRLSITESLRLGRQRANDKKLARVLVSRAGIATDIPS